MWLTEARLHAARRRIAAVVAGTMPPAALGEIRLRDEQRLAVARTVDLLDRHGGALLADEVGRGKTFVALAVARRWTRPLLVAPASLRETWDQAMGRADVHCTFVSHESLSRRRAPPIAPDGVIVDESHGFRSTTARRHAMLAGIAARIPVLLVSATPLQNRPRDLAAQLAIFLGARAFTMSPAALARFVVRTPVLDPSSLPVVLPARWIRLPTNDGAVLHAILGLPPPPRALDAGDGGVLRTIALVRAWASSRAALRRMIERRRSIATAIEKSAADGVWPTRREIRSWVGGERTTQLGFASLLAVTAVRGAAAGELREVAKADLDGLERVERAMRGGDDPDACRVGALRALRAAHPAARILAFSELAGTVRAYWSALRNDAGVGMLTSRESRIASGRIPRGELLGLFCPRARRAPRPHRRETVSLLLATDLLSEGVNLQDAQVVVHLDLPWNPARLEQRVGRVRRPGGAAEVRTYLMSPPASAELLLRVESRLRDKLEVAERTIGRTVPVVPSLAPRPAAGIVAPRAPCVASAESLGEMHSRMARWRCEACERRGDRSTRPFVAGAVAAHAGWLAALATGRLIASVAGAPPDDTMSLIEATRLADGRPRRLRPSEAAAARRALARFLEAEQLERDCGLQPDGGDVARTCERAIAQATAAAPRHVLPSALRMAQRLRQLLRYPRSLGVERELLAHARSAAVAGRPLEWLGRAIALATPASGDGRASPVASVDPDERNASSVARAPAGDRSQLVAMIVFGP